MAQVSSGIVSTPLAVNWDVIPGESLKQLKVHQIQYSNNSDETAELGWGEMLPAIAGRLTGGSTFVKESYPIDGDGPDEYATATLNLTADIVLTSIEQGVGRNGDTFTLQVLAAAANPTNTVLAAFSGTAAAIVLTITPNDGTNNSATPVTCTTANIVELINTGAVTGKSFTVSGSTSFRTLQTATGGGATAVADAGEGDGVAATFASGDAPIVLCFPKKADVVGFVIGTAASAALTVDYWNGSAWAALTGVVTPDFETTGIQNLVFQAPAAWERGGGLAGWYCLRIDSDDELVITSAKAGRILDKIVEVPTLDAGIMNYPLEPMGLFGSYGLFSYAIQTDDGLTASNEVIVDYESI